MRLSNRTTIICLLYLTIVALFSSAATTHLVQAVITCTSYTPECGFFPNLKERERYIARMQALCSSNPNDVKCANFRRTFGFMSDDSSNTLAREAQRAPKKQTKQTKQRKQKRQQKSEKNNKEPDYIVNRKAIWMRSLCKYDPADSRCRVASKNSDRPLYDRPWRRQL